MDLNERDRRATSSPSPILAQSMDTGSGSESNYISTLITLGQFWFEAYQGVTPTEGFFVIWNCSL